MSIDALRHTHKSAQHDETQGRYICTCTEFIHWWSGAKRAVPIEHPIWLAIFYGFVKGILDCYGCRASVTVYSDGMGREVDHKTHGRSVQ